MSNLSRTPVELLLNNRLDKDIKKMFEPYNIMLSIFFSSKCKIRDSYITTCEKKYPVILFFIISFFNAFCIYRYLAYTSDIHNAKTYSFFSLFYILYVFGYTLLIICNIAHNRSHISLIMTIQEIHRSFDMSVRTYIIWNWILVMSIFLFLISTTVCYFVFLKSIEFHEIGNELVIIVFELNLVYSIHLVSLLTKYLKEWVKNVLLDIEEENDEYCEKLFKIYLNILEAFSLCKTCFQPLILWRTIDSFFRDLLFLETHLIHLQNRAASNHEPDLFSSLLSGVVAVLVINDMTLIIITSAQCEKFYVSLEETKEACIQRLMNTNCPKSVRHLCKRVLQVNRTFSKMTACGLFNIDATLPIPLIGLMTEYIIVLLQFAFL